MYFDNISSYLFAPSSEEENEEFYFLPLGMLDYTETSEPSPSLLDFSEYGIDIIEDNGKVFFPVPTLSDMYSSVNLAVVYCNGDIFYYNSVIMSGGARDQDENALAALMKNQNRSDELANYAYREICFKIDNFFGFPCTQSPFMNRAKEVGLDAALEEYDPFTKELILSKDSADHIAGLNRLFNYWLCDGGHTGLYFNDLVNCGDDLEDDFYRVVFSIQTNGDIETDYENVYYDYMENYWDNQKLIASTKSVMLGNSGYVEDGDTAMISFDDFDIDFDAWENYLKNGGELPVSSADTFGFVYSCLERAKQNPDIKYIVFDLTTNGGGYIAVYLAIVSLINGTADYNIYDRFTGEKDMCRYIADRNLDGAIDDADLEYVYSDFKYAVLTSSCSFSCANLFPAAMKDAGCPIIGEQSGGGTCPLAYASTAEGLEYIISGGDTILINRAGESIDDGVPVDVDLLRYTDSGLKVYTSFFNIPLLSDYIRGFYSDFTLGDVNGDGKINFRDTKLFADYIAGRISDREIVKVNSDLNDDGKVNAKDITLLKKFIAGLVNENELNLTNSDMNGDGKHNARDLNLIKQQISS